MPYRKKKGFSSASRFSMLEDILEILLDSKELEHMVMIFGYTEIFFTFGNSKIVLYSSFIFGSLLVCHWKIRQLQLASIDIS